MERARHRVPRVRLLRRWLPAALASTALASAAIATAAATAPASVAAEACPGSGTGPCPYTSVQVIGQRAEGLLRFPEAVAVDTLGNVYVADQLSYVVQKFTAAGAFETEWGSFGGGHGHAGDRSREAFWSMGYDLQSGGLRLGSGDAPATYCGR